MIPAFQACMQSALFRANIKPPVELVVANLVFIEVYKFCMRRVEKCLETLDVLKVYLGRLNQI